MDKKKCKDKIIIKKCHVCGTVIETLVEARKCHDCGKSFLPSNYFGKVHAKNDKEYETLFQDSAELHEDDLIKGIHVLW